MVEADELRLSKVFEWPTDRGVTWFMIDTHDIHMHDSFSTITSAMSHYESTVRQRAGLRGEPVSQRSVAGCKWPTEQQFSCMRKQSA